MVRLISTKLECIPAGGWTLETHSSAGMTPQLYACMIDVGCCQGRLQERGCREGGETEDE